MKALKKVLAMTLAAAISVSFAACGGADDGTVTLDENGFFKGIKASKYVTLPEYKGIEVPIGATVPDAERVQEELDILASKFDTYVEVTDRAVEDGDTVNVDYVAYLDGQAVNGTNTGRLGKEVVIGEKITVSGETVEDDFTEQLIGAMPGDEVTVTVTYPENGFDERARGKEVDFKVTVNHIRGDVIKAELTDELAQTMGHASLAALKADVEDWLVSSTKFDFFIEILNKATCESIPEGVIEYLKNDDIAQYEYYASMSGVTVEEYIKNSLGYDSLDKYVEAHMESYRSNAVLYLAAQAIAEKENLSVSSEDMAGYADYIEEYGEPYIKQFILYQEILPAFIAENGIPTEMPEDTAAE